MNWKKIKRITALAGALLLIGLYLLVLILGITASPATKNVLMAAIGCTVVIPCLIYGMMLIARVLGDRNPKEPSSDESPAKRDRPDTGKGPQSGGIRN